MASGFINMPNCVGKYIRKAIEEYRERNNLSEPSELRKVYNKNENFLPFEFDLVEDLFITDEMLKYLHLFKNVKGLTISCSYQFSNEELNSLINKFPNLIRLTVQNQNNISYIDLSSQTNIENLFVKSNKNLISIRNFENLNNLKELTIFDNPSLRSIFVRKVCMKAFALASKGKCVCNLDVLHMNEMLKVLPRGFTIEDLDMYNITWNEYLIKNGVVKDLTYTSSEYYESFKLAKKLFDSLIRFGDSQEQIFAIINEWMGRYIKYDYKGEKCLCHLDEEGNMIGKRGGTNGSANAFLYESCVCQGYVKAAQLLLSLADITSYEVGCIGGENKDKFKFTNISFDGEQDVSFGNHSIIRVEMPSGQFYSDITGAERYARQGRILLSKNLVSRIYRLIFEDDVETPETPSISTQMELVEFAKKRVDEVGKVINLEGMQK